IIVAREKISVVESQSSSVSRNYQELSKDEMENKFYEWQTKVSIAKERRKKTEEHVMQLTWETEELEKQIQVYYEKMSEMFSGQRELASSKLL
ncbi:hypothetical protein, partial [Salmonella sp. s51933]|uniref:hypothetical protein n=1 Tax=Salmonella sp. s51933 TaxID=3160127 RepID=UPI003754945B